MLFGYGRCAFKFVHWRMQQLFHSPYRSSYISSPFPNSFHTSLYACMCEINESTQKKTHVLDTAPSLYCFSGHRSFNNLACHIFENTLERMSRHIADI